MNNETIQARPSARTQRVDGKTTASVAVPRLVTPAVLLVAITSGFIVLGGGSLELTDSEARLGLAAGESVGPLAQVFGGWDPTLAPGKVLISQLWAWLDGGTSTGAVRWPSALAAVAIGLLMARRLTQVLGERAGVLACLAILGTLGMIDGSALLGIDAMAGLAIIGSLDRILSRGSDWIAGLWAAGAILLGGWPALAIVLLCVIVIGRPGGATSMRLVVPPVAAFLAWSIWAIASTRAEVWAAALTWPVTQPSSRSLAPWALGAGLPWAPLALIWGWPSIRESWDDEARSLVRGWLQVAGISVLAGTLIPGLSSVCTVPILVGLAITASASLDRAWTGGLPAGPRWSVTILATILGLGWAGLAVYSGAYMAAAQPYYRIVAFVLLILGLGTGLMALDVISKGSTRGAVRVLILVAIGLKVAHSDVYVTETNYRFGKGPWGRAVGQYVPPRSPIYITHDISPALALATEHPVRRLRTEVHLKAEPGEGPKFVLLTLPEFEHWPDLAPKILKVRVFQDEYGGTRVLARTEGRLIRRDQE
ncbi:MAG: hypothetical protein JWN86_1255 [Planctomycetota bacterium]|nr:hypothetical protein [Planctomycetota bacterium]